MGIKVHTLTAATDEVKQVWNWIENGIFDALERKFLKEVHFCVLSMPEAGSNCHGNLLESYQVRNGCWCGHCGTARRCLEHDEDAH